MDGARGMDLVTRRIVISGCSGGGKSTILAALAAQGFQTCPEPGRRIVQEERATGGTALPWVDAAAFATRAVAIAIADHAAAGLGITFFDRSLIDAVTWFERNATPLPGQDLVAQFRYEATVFLTPSWPAIYATDPDRQHGLADAVAEFDSLLESYPAKGYGVAIIPHGPVADRVAWILARVQGPKGAL
jgi:predicted ATPase